LKIECSWWFRLFSTKEYKSSISSLSSRSAGKKTYSMISKDCLGRLSVFTAGLKKVIYFGNGRCDGSDDDCQESLWMSEIDGQNIRTGIFLAY